MVDGNMNQSCSSRRRESRGSNLELRFNFFGGSNISSA
jgi:hypothetical protein